MLNIYYINCPGCPNNVGDMLGPYILEKISKIKPIQKAPSDNLNESCLMMVGSTARDSRKNSILSGVGIILKNDTIKEFKDVWAVRGKKTLEKVKETINKNNYNIDINDIALGDPGILMPFFYPNYLINTVKKKYKYGVILHYVDDIKVFRRNLYHKNVIFISVSLPVEEFINQIILCEKILSSSLHGIILANAYNIPVCWIRFPKTILPLDDIKFHDYFSAFFKEEQKCYIINSKTDPNNIPNNYFVTIDNFELVRIQNHLYDKILNNVNKLLKLPINMIYSYENTNTIFKNFLNQNKNFFINRIGGNELDIYFKYLSFNKNVHMLKDNDLTYLKKYAGYYDLDNNMEVLGFFLQTFEDSYKNSDVIMIANSAVRSKLKYLLPTSPYYLNSALNINYLNQLINDKICVNYDYLENFRYLHEWFPLLDNKRILIISPFQKEIIQQLKIKDELFKENFLFKKFKYPNFKNIIFIDSPLTLNNFSVPHRNWLETYNNLTLQIKNQINNYDIAVLMCGCYASPLGNYIKKIGKSAIYFGGIGQLLFGINGNRFDIPYYKQIMNNNWIFPELRSQINVDKTYANNEGLKAYF